MTRMIVPRHKICDMCGHEVGVNIRYFIVKSKCLYVGYAGSCSDNKKHHICEKCMSHIGEYVRMKEGEANE